VKPEFRLPTQSELVELLRRHPLIKLREPVTKAFVVGSFARGTQNEHSDVDVLLEVRPRSGQATPIPQLEEQYRQALRQYFVRNDIRGRCDEAHPQWCGRRVDIYLTYDAEAETRPKVRLRAPDAAPEAVLEAPAKRATRRAAARP
jgi:predicted nucleotidyltransferase